MLAQSTQSPVSLQGRQRRSAPIFTYRKKVRRNIYEQQNQMPCLLVRKFLSKA